MKAALFYAPHSPMRIEAIDIADPVGREVLVRTVASGVCHSDLHAIDRGSAPSPQPVVLGHEAAGIVGAVGPHVSYVQPGDHVIACLSFFCGKCDYCLVGRPNLCSDKPNRGPDSPPRLSQGGRPLTQAAGIGAYAEQMLVHENALVKIRKDMPLDKAALISCGVVTGVGAVLNRARVAPGSTVAVLGVGGVGMSVIQGARIAGARQIIAVDVVDYKLERAREFGATHVVNAAKVDPVETVRRAVRGRRRLLVRGDRVRRDGPPGLRDAARRRLGHHARHGAGERHGGGARQRRSGARRCSRAAAWARTGSRSTCRATSSSTTRASCCSTR